MKFPVFFAIVLAATGVLHSQETAPKAKEYPLAPSLSEKKGFRRGP